MTTFTMVLAPYRQDDEWAVFDVRYRVQVDSVPAGAVLLSLPRTMVSMPGSRIEDLSASDETGQLVLTEGGTTTDPSGVYRHWSADRSTSGPLQVALRAPVRKVDELTPVGPLFDLRPEPFGLFGVGLMFVPLPDSPGQFDITVDWDLPVGVSAVTTRGTGAQSWSGDLKSVAMCYYGAGTPVVQPEDDPGFGIHAYSDVPFDLKAVADYVRSLHQYMRKFFEDDDASYHVLVRRFLGKGGGGTALPPGSFAFGYSAQDPATEDQLRSLLAHEMTHNWPHLDGLFDGGGLQSWYSEGAAEYYSTVLPLRAGLLTAERFAEYVSERFAAYDINPLRVLDNVSAAQAYWTDPRAQRIPYGRGFQYLVATDAHIRIATDGDRSLDDVVLDLLRAQRAGRPAGPDEWVRLVVELCGDVGRDRYEQMVSGIPIEQPDVVWEGVARPVKVRRPELDLGFDVTSYRDSPRLVKGLAEGSAGASAGLREGDELVDHSLPYHAVRRSDTDITIPVRRDGRVEHITYVPRGADVPSTAWTVLEPGTPL